MESIKKILIIDDDEDVRRSIKEALAKLEFKILTASNGREGLAYLENNAIDIIILDVFMPEKDGIETIQEIRKQNPDVIVIAASGQEWCGFLLKTMKSLGANYIIEKPILFPQLIDLLNSL